MVKACPVVLPGQSGGQNHDPLLVIVGLERVVDLIRDLDRCGGQGVSVAENRPLFVSEDRGIFVIAQRPELLLSQTLLSADRRPDIDSERTANESRHSHLSQDLHPLGNAARLLLGHLHLTVTEQ